MNVIDQILHVVVFGVISFVGSAVTGCAAVVAYELCDWHWDVGPITIGQWPAGKPFVTDTLFGDGEKFSAERIQTISPVLVTQMDRVEDLRTDLFFELAGVAIGQAAQLVVLWMVML